jgi:hypothetical protein
MKILIKNCLEPLHPKYSSLVADLEFPSQILMTVSPNITVSIKDILDNIMIQMAQEEYNIIAAKIS